MKNFLIILIILIGLIGSTAAQTSFKTPKAAAEALYSAWRTKNRKKAALAADSGAVSKLFSTNFISKRKFSECRADEDRKDLFYCIYEVPEDSLLNVAFETVKRKNGWRVRQVTFEAEN